MRIGVAQEQTTLQDLLVEFLEARYPEEQPARKPARKITTKAQMKELSEETAAG